MYKLKKIVGSNDFSAQFIKVISHYKKIGCGNFASFFNCTLAGRTSDSMTVPSLRLKDPDEMSRKARQGGKLTLIRKKH